MDAANIRRTYAENLRGSANLHLERVVDAFARVPRETFLGPGPWQIARPLDPACPYRTSPDAGLEHIYQDVAIAIDSVRQLNNGQPSTHARWLEAAAPQSGESVLHIGCGVGYYTAILAELVGPSGRVVAYEIDADLVTRARACLRDWPQVQVEFGDGSEPHGPHDVVYVNAGATHARKEWLSSLAPGGRMILPLTVHIPMFPHGVGLVVCLKRDDGRWPARVVSPVGIYDCIGARDETAESQLRKLLNPDASARIHALSIESHPQGDKCLLHLDGFCLQE
jgi:protein-L-isoaspartate(D-aspartate) O-methyltransferase